MPELWPTRTAFPLLNISVEEVGMRSAIPHAAGNRRERKRERGRESKIISRYRGMRAKLTHGKRNNGREESPAAIKMRRERITSCRGREQGGAR